MIFPCADNTKGLDTLSVAPTVGRLRATAHRPILTNWELLTASIARVPSFTIAPPFRVDSVDDPPSHGLAVYMLQANLLAPKNARRFAKCLIVCRHTAATVGSSPTKDNYHLPDFSSGVIVHCTTLPPRPYCVFGTIGASFMESHP